MAIKEYPDTELADQPIGYWSGAAGKAIVRYVRASLAKEQLTLPQWVVLLYAARFPGTWTRETLAARVGAYCEPGTAFEPLFAELFARGWFNEADGILVLTPAGEAGFARARGRVAKANAHIRRGISEDEYLTTLSVLRRMIDNVGGDSDLP
jgi:DNA-binding MarR family transcriptional regulator